MKGQKLKNVSDRIVYMSQVSAMDASGSILPFNVKDMK